MSITVDYFLGKIRRKDSVTGSGETTTTLGVTIGGAQTKTPLIDADRITIWDSVTNLLKTITYANLKASLKTYFDTIYNPIGGSSATMWQSLAGATRISNNTINVLTNFSSVLNRGSIIKWQESGIQKIGLLSKPTVWDGTNTTLYFVGNRCTSIDANSLFCFILSAEQFTGKFASAGNIATAGSDMMNIFFVPSDSLILGADMQAGTAGVSGSTIIDIINQTGNVTVVSSLTLGTGTRFTDTIAPAIEDIGMIANDKLFVKINAVQATPAVDLYINLYYLPKRYLGLK